MYPKRQFIVYNPTGEALVVYDVGKFQPGDNLIELTYEQEYLLSNNAILKMRMVKPKVETKPKVSERRHFQPRKVEQPKVEQPKKEEEAKVEEPKTEEPTLEAEPKKEADPLE